MVVAAGPTTSTRMELFEDKVIAKFKVRLVIGKGGMGEKTTSAMKKHGAVYGAYTGGTALLAARTIKKIKSVAWLELGMPEAMWVLEVEKFGPLVIAIDAHGNNLYKELNKKIQNKRQKFYEKLDV
jgi:tartrate/fumarate subfamily iron-sulfur-dependent hydro-lyase beta chain